MTSRFLMLELNLGQSVLQTSRDWKRCNRILQGIQKESEEVLRFAFHDTMFSRRKWSGMNRCSFQKRLLKSWKAYVDDQKILKLRSDLGLKRFCDFLSGLSDAEREMVFPLLREAQEKISDCRVRRKEIRVEKSFTFRKYLAEEPSIVKRRALLDDWLEVSDFVQGVPDEDCYGFLRRSINFEDGDLQAFLEKKVKETARLAGRWIRDGCRSFAWFKSDGCPGFYSQPMLDEVWTSCTFGKHDDFGTQFGFYLPMQFIESFYKELGLLEGDESFLDFQGLWMPVRSLDSSSLFRILALVWKCRDDEMQNKGTFMMDHIQNVFTTWTNQDCLAVLGGG